MLQRYTVIEEVPGTFRHGRLLKVSGGREGGQSSPYHMFVYPTTATTTVPRVRALRDKNIQRVSAACPSLLSVVDIGPCDVDPELGGVPVVFELLPDITLRDFVKVNSSAMSEKDVVAIVQQILTALKVLHNKDIVHTALTPDTIWIRPQGGLQVVVGGYGFGGQGDVDVSFLEPSSLSGGFSTMFDQKGYDLWSVGMVTYFLLSRGEQLVPPLPAPIPFPSSGVSERAKEFVRALLASREADRTRDASAALLHPWIPMPAASKDACPQQ